MTWVTAGVAIAALGGTSAWAGDGSGSSVPRSFTAGQEQSRIVGRQVLTAQQKADIATKDAQPVASQAAGTSSRTVTKITHSAQQRTYWCGPAALVSLLGEADISISQTTAARKLSTTSNGTDWSNGSYHPMENGLDDYIKHHSDQEFNYVSTALAYSPSKADKRTYKARLVRDTDLGYGIAGNALEVRNGPHLNGHPNLNIYHWIAIRGYAADGSKTRYVDPVAGSSISWAGPVNDYNGISSNTMTTILGGRGYVW